MVTLTCCKIVELGRKRAQRDSLSRETEGWPHETKVSAVIFQPRQCPFGLVWYTRFFLPPLCKVTHSPALLHVMQTINQRIGYCVELLCASFPVERWIALLSGGRKNNVYNMWVKCHFRQPRVYNIHSFVRRFMSSSHSLSTNGSDRVADETKCRVTDRWVTTTNVWDYPHSSPLEFSIKFVLVLQTQMLQVWQWVFSHERSKSSIWIFVTVSRTVHRIDNCE